MPFLLQSVCIRVLIVVCAVLAPSVTLGAPSTELVQRHTDSIGAALGNHLPSAASGSEIELVAYRYLASGFVPAEKLETLGLIELRALPFPPGAVTPIKVNGKAVPLPSVLGEISSYQKNILNAIAASPNGRFTYNDGVRDIVGIIPPLGQGNQGIAYDIGGGQVLNLPKSHVAAIASIKIEDLPSQFWADQKDKAFSIVHKHETNNLGLFTISERDFGEPMTETLLRAGVFEVTQGRLTLVSESSKWKLTKDQVETLNAAVRDLVDVMNHHPEMSLSISPNNLHVTFEDAAKKRIKKVTLLGFGPFLERVVPEADFRREHVQKLVPFLWEKITQEEERLGRQLTSDEIVKNYGFQKYSMRGKPYLLYSEYNQIKTFGDFLQVSERKIEKYLARRFVSPELQPYADLYNGLNHPIRGPPGWDLTKLRTGDIIGISNRKGGTPFLIQAGTLSTIDHVGLIHREGDKIFVYQFTNSRGSHRADWDTFVKDYSAPDGTLKGMVIRKNPPLTSAEESRLVQSSEKIVAGSVGEADLLTSNLGRAPKSCSHLVKLAFEMIGVKVGRLTPEAEITHSAFNGFTEKIWKYMLPGHDDLIFPRSFFESQGFARVFDHLPEGLVWTDAQMLQAWRETGDMSIIGRVYSATVLRMARVPDPAGMFEEVMTMALRNKGSHSMGGGEKRCLGSVNDALRRLPKKPN